MRRSEKEISDPGALERILRTCCLCRLGLCREGEPYVVPLYYGYRDGSLYIHCATDGLKLDILRENSRVCFEIEEIAEYVPSTDDACGWSVRYRSLVGHGTARILESFEDLALAAEVLVSHMGGSPPDDGYARSDLAGMGAIRVDIESMTGKQSGIQEE